ncbi:MAG: hypothetical protein AAF541_16335 [Pseudomonadota bacterium]
MAGLFFQVVTVQAESTDLKRQMSADEFEAAGLHKLSIAELQALQDWLSGNRPEDTVQQSVPEAASPAAVAAPAPPMEPKADPEEDFGREQVRERQKPAETAPASITARIQGEFRGWDGSTIFRLDNGQVWQQRVGGKYRSPRRIDPEVTLSKGRFGYYLSLVGSRRSVGVRRLR